MSAVVTDTRKDLLLFPRQWQFVADRAHYPAYVGGIGSGKTFAGAVKVITRLGRKQFGLVASPTYDMLRLTTQRTLFALLDQLGIAYEYNRSDKIATIPASGHEIIFRSLDDPEKVRGPNVHYCWVDEGSLISGEAWKIVTGRARLEDGPDWPFQAWNTCTPKGRNYVWEVWERDANAAHPLYRVRSAENPELPEDFVQSLGYTGLFAQQELLGEFVAFEGLVWPEFSREHHVATQDCTGWRAILGVDVGTRNPTAILTVRGEPERRHVEREVYRRGLSSEEIVSLIEAEADRVNPERIFLDPSAAAYIETLQQHGYPAEKAENDVIFGIGQVATAFADGLTIDPACVNLMAELEAYHYPENRLDSDKPVKENDHACDALRYAIASEANVLIPGIFVLD